MSDFLASCTRTVQKLGKFQNLNVPRCPTDRKNVLRFLWTFCCLLSPIHKMTKECPQKVQMKYSLFDQTKPFVFKRALISFTTLNKFSDPLTKLLPFRKMQNQTYLPKEQIISRKHPSVYKFERNLCSLISRVRDSKELRCQLTSSSTLRDNKGPCQKHTLM